MTYSIYDNEIFDTTGLPVIADSNGIINIEIQGHVKRFVKSKLIRFMKENPGVIPIRTRKYKPKEKVDKVKTIKVKTIKVKKVSVKAKKKHDVKRSRHGIMVWAKKGERVLGPFISLAACGREIGLTKATVSKILSGYIKGSEWIVYTN